MEVGTSLSVDSSTDSSRDCYRLSTEIHRLECDSASEVDTGWEAE
jgi:hypothetical protein